MSETPPPEGNQGKSVDERLAEQEARIDGLGSKIDALLEKLTPGSPSKGGQGDLAPQSPSIADQVAEGVAKIEAGKKQREAEEADAKWRKEVSDHLAEHKPAEPAPLGRLDKVRRALYGG